MKNRKKHILSIFLMIFMALLTIATSYSSHLSEEIENSIFYESREDYYLIKIKTKNDPINYSFNNGNNYILLSFDDEDDLQEFSYDLKSQKTKISIISKNPQGGEVSNGKIMSDMYVSEQIFIDEMFYETFTEDEYFIIKIKKEFIKYENAKIGNGIFFSDKKGNPINEEYR